MRTTKLLFILFSVSFLSFVASSVHSAERPGTFEIRLFNISEVREKGNSVTVIGEGYALTHDRTGKIYGQKSKPSDIEIELNNSSDTSSTDGSNYPSDSERLRSIKEQGITVGDVLLIIGSGKFNVKIASGKRVGVFRLESASFDLALR